MVCFFVVAGRWWVVEWRWQQFGWAEGRSRWRSAPNLRRQVIEAETFFLLSARPLAFHAYWCIALIPHFGVCFRNSSWGSLRVMFGGCCWRKVRNCCKRRRRVWRVELFASVGSREKFVWRNVVAQLSYGQSFWRWRSRALGILAKLPSMDHNQMTLKVSSQHREFSIQEYQ